MFTNSTGGNLCIDEQMIPFKGKFIAKQYMKSKPTPWGLKLFVLCGKSGQPFDFVMYQGSSTEISDYLRKFGFGASVVLHLTQRIKEPEYKLYFDNYFTSYNLLEILKNRGINAIGTARINRFYKPMFSDDRQFKKQNRGYTEQCVSKDGNIAIVKWLDSKPVHLASNFMGKGEMETIKRWDKSIKRYVDVPQPEIVRSYNECMGGVDLLDQLIQYYRVSIRSKKWPLRVLTHFMDFAICASWTEYKTEMRKQNIPEKHIIDLLDFRLQVAQVLMNSFHSSRKRGRPPADITNNQYQTNSPRTQCEVRP